MPNGAFRAYAPNCGNMLSNTPYEYNGRFVLHRQVGQAWDMINQRPSFKQPNIRPKYYRTVFGPVFPSRTNVVARDNDGISSAVLRLTCKRSLTVAGYDERLYANQMSVVAYLGLELEMATEIIRDSLTKRVALLGTPQSERYDWCHAPHPKRALRVRAFRQLTSTGREHHTNVQRVGYKQKPHELLALSKCARGVGDLTTPGAAKFGYYMEHVKLAFQDGVTLADDFYRFAAAPDCTCMNRIFTDVIRGRERIRWYSHSDDVIVGIRCADGEFLANLDISKCDGSHYDPTFGVLKNIMDVDSRFSTDLSGAFKQCRLPLVVNSEDFTQKVILKPKYDTLYSGSVLTTSVNNTATLLIFMCLRRLLDQNVGYTKAQIPGFIMSAAERSGYIMKADVCENIEDLQFLKRSPVALSDGTFSSYLNIAVWLRGFGATKSGDLPGRSTIPLSTRAHLYNAGVVRSHVHDGDHVIARAFRHAFSGGDLEVVSDHSFSSSDGVYIPTESLARRYHTTAVEFEELAQLIAHSKIGWYIRTPLVDKIFEKDYGY